MNKLRLFLAKTIKNTQARVLFKNYSLGVIYAVCGSLLMNLLVVLVPYQSEKTCALKTKLVQIGGVHCLLFNCLVALWGDAWEINACMSEDCPMSL